MFDKSQGSQIKRCGRCFQEKPLEDFAWRRINQGQRDNYCRVCRAAYKQDHYAKNKQKYIDSAAVRRRRTVEERFVYILGYLKEHPCADCGETDVVVLEFDHQGKKNFMVSEGIRNRNWEDVLAEIEKCEVVCANCHRRRTARAGGFIRYLRR